ncbi:unnamed protein product, partial [Ixodes hexagonus]
MSRHVIFFRYFGACWDVVEVHVPNLVRCHDLHQTYLVSVHPPGAAPGVPLPGPRVGTGSGRGRYGRQRGPFGVSRRGCRASGVAQARGVVHAGHEAQPVARRKPLASPQGAQPPALQVARVLLQHREHIVLPEGQLLGRLGNVVIQGAGQAVL